MTLATIVTWIVFGLVVGLVANLIDPHPNRMGIVGSVVLGIIGAVLGGLVAGLFGLSGVTGFNLYSFVVALIGSLVVLWVGRSLYAPGYGAEYYDEDADIDMDTARSNEKVEETHTRRVTRDDV